ncbi:MAG: response regulator [Candidatus Aminicenantes bacterium]
MDTLEQKSTPLNNQGKIPSILVVEDENIIAMDLKVILENFGFDVYGPVPSGETSIKAASFFRPDVVLMDVRLKGKMSGIDAARLIHHHLSIPVIYLTAYGDEATVKEATNNSSFRYIRKPFEESEVEDKIRALL